MGCSCQREDQHEAKLTLEMNQEVAEEDILSPRTLEGRFLIMVKSIKSISPLIKMIMDEQGPFKYDIKKDMASLVLREKDESDAESTYYGFFNKETKLREYKGVIIYNDGSVYEGHISEGLPSGKGRKFFVDSNYYVGDFLKGNPHGKGRMTTPSGNFYEGDWVNGLREGEGLEEFAGETYEGKFKEDSRNGYGVWSKNGNKYNGMVCNGVPEGYGVFHWADGSNYTGDWFQGKPHGKGKMCYKDGSEYEGEFENGERNGRGKLVSAEGDVFEGNWLHNQKEGEMLISGKDKPTVSSIWRQDKLVSIKEQPA
eukprot:TRINITY_DN1277_c0_g1_i5.p1 TRINITY_DN1277_c0_g1~~TRINITY_DN1277_c0_g1_i5.p1  ORF type:complete len:312 (-),score=93.91 TRINITY_DN1277_c0_g1_i5:135-1070(-)